MAQFNLSDTVDSSKVFLVKRSEIEDRLEPKFYTIKYFNNEKKIRSSKYPISYLFDVTSKISDGTHFTPNYIDEGVKFISVKDVRKSAITLTNTKFISDEEANKLDKRCKPTSGDILLTKIGATYGFAAMIETKERFQIFVSLALLRPNDKLIPKFLEIYLNTDLAYIQYERVIKGAGVPDLHLEDIRKIKIPLPPKEVQKQVIDLYQTAYTQKQQKEAEAAALLASIDTYLLDELGITLPEKDTSLQSRIFTAMFSEVSGGRFESQYYTQYNKDILKSIENSKYPIEKIKKHTQFISGYAFSSDDYIEFSECYLITIKNISKNTVELENVTYLPNHFFEDYTKFQINRNDLLIAMTGATIGKVGIYESNDKALLNQRNGIIKSEKLNTFYLMNLLNTEVYQSLILKNSVGGAQPNISETDITRIGIPLPPREKQDEIAKHIQDIRTQAKQLQEEAKAVLEEAKRGVEKMILG